MQKNRLGNFPTRFIIEPLFTEPSARFFYILRFTSAFYSPISHCFAKRIPIWYYLLQHDHATLQCIKKLYKNRLWSIPINIEDCA